MSCPDVPASTFVYRFFGLRQPPASPFGHAFVRPWPLFFSRGRRSARQRRPFGHACGPGRCFSHEGGGQPVKGVKGVAMVARPRRQESPRATVASLFYLRHIRTCACSSAGCSGQTHGSGGEMDLFSTPGYIPSNLDWSTYFGLDSPFDDRVLFADMPGMAENLNLNSELYNDDDDNRVIGPLLKMMVMTFVTAAASIADSVNGNSHTTLIVMLQLLLLCLFAAIVVLTFVTVAARIAHLVFNANLHMTVLVTLHLYFSQKQHTRWTRMSRDRPVTPVQPPESLSDLLYPQPCLSVVFLKVAKKHSSFEFVRAREDLFRTYPPRAKTALAGPRWPITRTMKAMVTSTCPP